MIQLNIKLNGGAAVLVPRYSIHSALVSFSVFVLQFFVDGQ
jgi:hypothetical protein